MASPVDPRLLRRTRAIWLVAGVGVGIATAMLVISQSWLLSHVVASTVEAGRLARAGLLVPLALVFLGRAVCAWATQFIAHRASVHVKARLRDDVISARLSRPAEPTSTSTLIQLVTTGLDALDGYFAKYLPQMVLASIVPMLVIAVVAFQDWVSAVIIMVTIPLIPVFMALVGWKTQERVERRWAVQNRLAQHFGDLVAGLPTLQVFGRAAAQEKGLEATERAHRRETMSTLRWSFLSSFVLELVATLSVAVVAVGVGLRVVHGQMDFATALFVLVLAPEAYLPLRLVGMHYHDSADGVAAADSAFAVIGAVPEGRAGRAPLPGPIAAVHIRDLGHTYPGTSSAALTGLNLTLKPGRIVALTGPSGGGKSTAIAALMGFITPAEGVISVTSDKLGIVSAAEPKSALGDQQDSQFVTKSLEELDLRCWREHLAYVAQTPGMIAGTVAENVRLGDPQADDARVKNALTRAGTDLALDKPVGDDGEGLSAGERRRVGIARALLRIDAGAQFFILDEPTAGLDADTEATVLRGLRDTGAGALVVTHRPAVLTAADEVVLL